MNTARNDRGQGLRVGGLALLEYSKIAPPVLKLDNGTVVKLLRQLVPGVGVTILTASGERLMYVAFIDVPKCPTYEIESTSKYLRTEMGILVRNQVVCRCCLIPLGGDELQKDLEVKEMMDRYEATYIRSLTTSKD